MCRAKDDPTCAEPGRRCDDEASPAVAAARGQAYQAGKKAAKLTRVPDRVVEKEGTPEAVVDAGTRDIETLRELAGLIDDAYAGEAGEAASELRKGYGSRLGAVRALGSAVVSRGEELAGLTADEAVASWKVRLAEAEESYKASATAHAAAQAKDLADFDAWAAEHHPGVNWEDTSGAGSLRYLRNQYDSEERKAAYAAFEAAGELFLDSGIKGATDPESQADFRKIADGLQSALAEVRALGGHLALHELSDKAAAAAVTEASSIYPADWVRASTEGGTLAATETKGRAYYRHEGGMDSDRVAATEPTFFIRPAGDEPRDTDKLTFLSVERGAGAGWGVDPATTDRWTTQQWEVKNVKNKPKGQGWEAVRPGTWRRKPRGRIDGPGLTIALAESLPGRPRGFSEAAHELGHRMQRVVPSLSKMEHDWLRDRTTVNGEREALVPSYQGGYEMVRPDNFTITYIGREYEGRDTTEVLTVGAQSIFGGDYEGLIGLGGRYKRDDDMRHFILGAMASAAVQGTGGEVLAQSQDQLATAA